MIAASTISFRTPDLVLVHSEIMRDLMPDRIGYHPFQFGARACKAFMRTLENRDLIGQTEPVENGALGQRPALIEAEHAATGRLTLDHHSYVMHAPAKTLRDSPQGIFNQEFELVR
jgi:hypothetical protein